MARKRPLVLVVEDDPALGEVIVSAMREEGLDARLASDGDEAMRLVDEFEPSCIVLDLMMPRRDGFSVLRELRAADYVTKPFELDDLIGRVRALITPAVA